MVVLVVLVAIKKWLTILIQLNLLILLFIALKVLYFRNEINIDELCKLSKISMEDAEAILPKFQKDYNVFFLWYCEYI